MSPTTVKEFIPLLAGEVRQLDEGNKARLVELIATADSLKADPDYLRISDIRDLMAWLQVLEGEDFTAALSDMNRTISALPGAPAFGNGEHADKAESSPGSAADAPDAGETPPPETPGPQESAASLELPPTEMPPGFREDHSEDSSLGVLDLDDVDPAGESGQAEPLDVPTEFPKGGDATPLDSAVSAEAHSADEALAASSEPLSDDPLGEFPADETVAPIATTAEPGSGAEDTAAPAFLFDVEAEMVADKIGTEIVVEDSTGIGSMMDMEPGMMNEFVEDALGHLQTIELNFLSLESDPGNLKIIDDIFRPFHTIKGVAGFLGLGLIHKICHEIESLLDDGRKGKIAITGAVSDLVLEVVDFLKEIIPLCKDAENLAAIFDQYKPEADLTINNIAAIRASFAGDTTLDSGGPSLGNILVGNKSLSEQALSSAIKTQEDTGQKLGEILIQQQGIKPVEIARALREQKAAQAAKGSDAPPPRNLQPPRPVPPAVPIPSGSEFNCWIN